MDPIQAKNFIKETLNRPFTKVQFVRFVKELFNHIDESQNHSLDMHNSPSYEQYIRKCECIGKYIDAENKRIDLLCVEIIRGTTLENARTMQRNFIADYLKTNNCDAALVAFYAEDSEDWRLSMIKSEYVLAKKDGKVKTVEELTPARRWSFLVGTNENTHTAQARLFPILEDDEKDPLLSSFEEAFNVEVVTKEFFSKYKELFDKLLKTIERIVKDNKKLQKEFETKNILVRDFAKKLLGQIVFLYFLQKKGWLGVGKNSAWGTGPKNFLRKLFNKEITNYDNFFNDMLEHMFYEALAEDRGRESYYSLFKCRIPFLNGGLFEPINNYDWDALDIILPNELFSNSDRTKEGDIGTGILDVFDRYNFTVKEDEPLEKEVAIDPEMLGKVFENLIEDNIRKSQGAYYTPREIVHYMCQESLINYLATELEGKASKEDIDVLIRQGERFIERDSAVARRATVQKYALPESVRTNADLIDKKLEDTRICDPAIGSGAFPVGMMTEIIKARSVLTNYIKNKQSRSPYEFKRHAIESCIYGVDIDSSAVDIAKLRLWLSLIVDEEDPTQIKPLPNLDYKIVCGNSLLGIETNLNNTLAIKAFEKLKPKFFSETNQKQKLKLKKEIDKLINEITSGKKLFDFKIFFSEVFHEKGGFDVVIGNPPYVEARSLTQQDVDSYRSNYLSAGNRINTFALFTEQGIKLSSNKGIVSYIIHRNSIRSNDYKNLRRFILDNSKIMNILSFKIGVFEDVTGEMTVIILKKEKCDHNFIKIGFLDNTICGEIKYKTIDQHIFNSLPDYRFNIYLTEPIIKILNKLNMIKKLDQFADVTQGIIVGDERKYIKKEKESEKYKPILRGRDISKYKIKFNNEYIYYIPGTKVLTRGKTEAIFKVKEKILTQHISSRIIAALDTDSYYYLQTINGLICFDGPIKPKYLLALLNSKLLNFYYEFSFNMGAEFTTAVAIENLNLLPIMEPEKNQQGVFIQLVNQILSITKDKDYLENLAKQARVKEYETQIDALVYKLYDLTPEEIKIVENK